MVKIVQFILCKFSTIFKKNIIKNPRKKIFNTCNKWAKCMVYQKMKVLWEKKQGRKGWFRAAGFRFQFSRSVVSDSLHFHGLQHARLPCPSPTLRACSNSYPSSWWCHPTISSLSSPSPAFNLSKHQSLFQWITSSHQVAKVVEFQLQHQSFQWIFRTDLL